MIVLKPCKDQNLTNTGITDYATEKSLNDHSRILHVQSPSNALTPLPVTVVSRTQIPTETVERLGDRDYH
jgi:hypothetical protein